MMLAGIVVLFTFQNIASATVSLLALSVTLPLSILVLLVYGLGMVTGGLAVRLARAWFRGAARKRP